MDLWTEYEGLTVDGSFPLKKLLQPEGRSAFFATTNAQGEAILIRLIECHFDEDEILARWRGVEALGHPNFLKIDRFGQLVIDDTTVAYAAFEKVETDLATVLEEGCLTADDARQIGMSLVTALDTLHSHGFVHEHVEARNVFAVGDAVKLRSDCIRETPEGEAGAEARRRDVQALSALVKHVLVGTRRFRRPNLQTVLPSPFEEIVRNGASGLWGLKEIGLALAPPKAPQRVVPVTPEPEKAATSGVLGKPTESNEKSFSFKKPVESAARRPVRSGERDKTERDKAGRERGPRARFLERATAFQHAGFEWPDWMRDRQSMARRWLIAGALGVLVLLIGLICMRWLFHHPSDTAHKPVATSSTAGRGKAAQRQAGSAAPARSTAQTGSGPAGATPRAASGKTQWRVVAFTYNQENQARKKASALAQRHPELNPEAFSPTGRAPWLVTVGGAMQRDEAYGLARKARSLGLPRDTYAQNYPAR